MSAVLALHFRRAATTMSNPMSVALLEVSECSRVLFNFSIFQLLLLAWWGNRSAHGSTPSAGQGWCSSRAPAIEAVAKRLPVERITTTFLVLNVATGIRKGMFMRTVLYIHTCTHEASRPCSRRV